MSEDNEYLDPDLDVPCEECGNVITKHIPHLPLAGGVSFECEECGHVFSLKVLDRKDRYPRCVCGSTDFKLGAVGGLSRNITCSECDREYNYTPFGLKPFFDFDKEEVIYKDTYSCDVESEGVNDD